MDKPNFDPTKVMQRAYSLIQGKAAVAKEGSLYVIRGTATTPTADRYGDVVEPLGSQFTLPLPLLWQHMSSEPLGNVTEAKAGADGIPFVAAIPTDVKSKNLRERIEEAVESVERGLVRAVSIGFRAIPGGYDMDPETYAFRFREWEWLELSLVTIPANPDAVIDIQTVKAFCAQALSGKGAKPVLLTAGEAAHAKRTVGCSYLERK